MCPVGLSSPRSAQQPLEGRSLPCCRSPSTRQQQKRHYARLRRSVERQHQPVLRESEEVAEGRAQRGRCLQESSCTPPQTLIKNGISHRYAMARGTVNRYFRRLDAKC